MSRDRETVERYMESFRRGDHASILACLTDDVEWVIPGAAHLHGKAEFDGEIANPAFMGLPTIMIGRTVEAGDTVVVEGSVRTQRKDGAVLHLAFCDVFDLRDGLIRRLVSYLM